MKKKIGIIGQFPFPMHGLSKALDTLYNSYLQQEFNFTKIDIKDNKKFILNLFKILFSKLDLYYLTISQSKYGNIRDLIIIKLIMLKKRKIVIHLHGGGFKNLLNDELSNIQIKLNKRILSEVDGVIVLGKSLKYIFESIVPNNKIYIVKNCVDNEYIMSDDEFIKKLNRLNEKSHRHVLYLSNFIEDKGYKKVLELAKKCNDNSKKEFKFIFAGKFFNKADEHNFFDYIQKNKLQEIIDYRGVVDGNEKLKLLNKSDIFILLTKYKNEGQPISIIEAGANGLSLISTNHAGIKDILKPEEMIDIRNNDIDIDQVYDMLIRKNNKQLLKENREKMIIEFSEEKYLQGLKNIFDKI